MAGLMLTSPASSGVNDRHNAVHCFVLWCDPAIADSAFVFAQTRPAKRTFRGEGVGIEEAIVHGYASIRGEVSPRIGKCCVANCRTSSEDCTIYGGVHLKP